jgi:GTP-binding protein EngB required for normal cell division
VPIRLLVLVLLTAIALLAFFLVLVATDTALSVWQRLQEAPVWIQLGYASLLILISVVAVWLAWRWMRPGSSGKPKKSTPGNAADLQSELVMSAAAGVDVDAALQELREQRKRKKSAEVYIALFGEVSTGKSSLVNALLPHAGAQQDARAGTTSEVQHYKWQAESGDCVMIADLPGFNFDEDPAILEEARRAHLVVFLCDSDLTRSQMEQLEKLKELDKPMVVALNKLDRYDGDEIYKLISRISKRAGLSRRDIVRVQTGGREQIIRQLSNGKEAKLSRERPADIDALRHVLQNKIDHNRELMESLRDTAVILLASEKLEKAKNTYREEQSDELVQRYSRRAILGAMAAVAPGSDLVIQGVLATKLIQELCALYGVSARDMEIDSFLRLAGSKVRNMTAITLAIAGNALKAFPGMGTLTGGLLHAVAYGMIFDSLGRAVAETLASRGELRPYPAAEAFEDLMRDNIQAGAVRFAQLALSKQDSNDKT